MALQISYEVSDRSEVEGVPGLYLEILLRRSEQGQQLRLEATVGITDEMTLGAVKIRTDDLHLRDDHRDQLIRAVCEGGWNAIMIDDMASVGIYWCDFQPWLLKHVAPTSAALILSNVQAAFGPCRCKRDAAKLIAP